jgi:hypothetical protein
VQHILEEDTIELFSFGGSQIATYVAISTFEELRWDFFRELEWEAEFVEDGRTYRGEEFRGVNEPLWLFIENVRGRNAGFVKNEDRIPHIVNLLSLGFDGDDGQMQFDEDVKVHIDAELQRIVPQIWNSVFNDFAGAGFNPGRALWLPFEQLGEGGQVKRKLFVFSPGITVGDEWRNVENLSIDLGIGPGPAVLNNEPSWQILNSLINMKFIISPTVGYQAWNLTGSTVVLSARLRQQMRTIERKYFRTVDNAMLSGNYRGKVVHKDVAADMRSEWHAMPYHAMTKVTYSCSAYHSLATPPLPLPPPPPQAGPQVDRMSQGRYCSAQLYSKVALLKLLYELAFWWLSNGLICTALLELDRCQLVPRPVWMTVAFLAMAIVYGGAALQSDLTIILTSLDKI